MVVEIDGSFSRGEWAGREVGEEEGGGGERRRREEEGRDSGEERRERGRGGRWTGV